MQLRNNPWIQLFEPFANNPIVDWYMDQWVSIWLKMYYWPAFMAGNADNITDIMKMPFKPMCFR